MVKKRRLILQCSRSCTTAAIRDLRGGVERLEEEVSSMLDRQGMEIDRLSYILLLRRCGNDRALWQGQRLHAHMVKNGHGGDTYLENLVIEMYGKCRSLKDAEAVFSPMRQRNAFSWTAMIAAYAQNGHLGLALQFFRQMLLEGMEPNALTFSTVLSVCTSQGAVEIGKAIHALIVSSALCWHLVIATSLLSMYGRCGDLEMARDVFERMPWRNVVSWNAMIAAYAQQGHHSEAWELYTQMEMDLGLKPNRATFLSVLGATGNLRGLAYGKSVHASIVAAGFEQDALVCSSLINMYGKCGSLGDAISVFERVERRTVVTWTAMIAAYAEDGRGIEALELFHQMDVKPDAITFAKVLDVCSSLKALEQGTSVHGRIAGSELETDVIVGTALLDMYGKCGSLENATGVFNKMPVRNVLSWTAMIAAYAQNGYYKEALGLFRRMDMEGMKPNLVTFMSILGSISSMRALADGKLIHSRVVAGALDSDATIGNALVHMYGRCGVPESARRVFEMISCKNLVSFSAMVAAYARRGYAGPALHLFQRMDLEGLRPDEMAFASILDACAHNARLAQGKIIHERLIASGFEADDVVGTALVNMYGKCGGLDDAKSVFERMCWKDVVSWSSLIAAYAQHGVGEGAQELFRQMRLEGIRTDEVTYSSILAACSHAGLLDEAQSYLVSMSWDDGITPSAEHYGSMIDLLARGGKLEQAEELIDNMPCQPGATAWMALLSACKTHASVERAERAAANAVELDARQPTPYVLLSSVFSHSG